MCRLVNSLKAFTTLVQLVAYYATTQYARARVRVCASVSVLVFSVTVWFPSNIAVTHACVFRGVLPCKLTLPHEGWEPPSLPTHHRVSVCMHTQALAYF
jgi:hypothetical protein